MVILPAARSKVKADESIREPPVDMKGILVEVRDEIAKLVVVAPVVVALEAVKLWRVVEPTTKSAPAPLNDEVAVVPNEALPALKTVELAFAILRREGNDKVQVLLVERS